VTPPEQIIDGRTGEKSRDVQVHDVEQRLADAGITRRTIPFMERQTQGKTRFFGYATFTHRPAETAARCLGRRLESAE
jgi:hypothetical protein